jgi:hypothetical protein
MIVFETNTTGYDIFYVVDKEKQYVGNVDKGYVQALVDYYKSFGNEVEIR